jgi:hypothetical protein
MRIASGGDPSAERSRSWGRKNKFFHERVHKLEALKTKILNRKATTDVIGLGYGFATGFPVGYCVSYIYNWIAERRESNIRITLEESFICVRSGIF